MCFPVVLQERPPLSSLLLCTFASPQDNMMLFEVKALASILLLPYVAGFYWPTSSVGGGGTRGCPAYTKLLPRYDDYRIHCEAEAGPSGADHKWPCFTMWSYSLANVNVTMGDSKIAPDDHFLMKDGWKTGKQPITLFLVSLKSC